jgi:hypothetical protein
LVFCNGFFWVLAVGFAGNLRLALHRSEDLVLVVLNHYYLPRQNHSSLREVHLKILRELQVVVKADAEAMSKSKNDLHKAMLQAFGPLIRSTSGNVTSAKQIPQPSA